MEEERARWHEDLVASCRVASRRIASYRVVSDRCYSRACRWKYASVTVTHACAEPRKSERAFCCTRQLATARRALALAAGCNCRVRVAVIDATPPLPSLSLSLSLSFSSSYSRVLPVEKTTNAPEFKGRRLSCPGSYWSRQYSSNEVSRSIGNWCCNRSDLPFYVSRVPFCSVASHSYYRRNLLRSTLLPLCFCSVDAATSTYN